MLRKFLRRFRVRRNPAAVVDRCLAQFERTACRLGEAAEACERKVSALYEAIGRMHQQIDELNETEARATNAANKLLNLVS